MALILLADDEAATRDLVSQALAMDGHQVVVTQEGTGAIEEIEAGKPFDLLITDVQMPQMDGLELIAKASSALPAMKIILMSGYGDQLQRANTITPTPRTILKPFTLEQIRAEVAEALA